MKSGKLVKSIIFCIAIIFNYPLQAADVPIHEFTLDNYSQNVNNYITSDGSTPGLLTEETANQHWQNFYRHVFSSDNNGLSPWSQAQIATELPHVRAEQQEILQNYDNRQMDEHRQHYALNFHPQDPQVLSRITANMHLDDIDENYHPEHRAIAIQNTLARGLPCSAPDFYHFTLPGQGFPFDNLQDSAIFAGTPLYVLHTTKDKAWVLVATPDDYISWVKSTDIALVSPEFITQWQRAVQKQTIAIMGVETPITDTEGQFHFLSYPGAVFPAADNTATARAPMRNILIPVRDLSGHAIIQTAQIPVEDSGKMPVAATEKNFSHLFHELQNRPYGWGGAYFYNDCSQEMKAIFTAFGIWLPRNSHRQTIYYHTLDLSDKTLNERLDILKTQGKRLLTIIYVDGHVMLYTGNINNQAMTYQNVWGLAPVNRDKRYVIGKSVFLPLLPAYPEAPDAASQASRKHFKLVFLDQPGE